MFVWRGSRKLGEKRNERDGGKGPSCEFTTASCGNAKESWVFGLEALRFKKDLWILGTAQKFADSRSRPSD